MQLMVFFFLTIKDVYDTWHNQSIIKHTKSACLPIIESKSILDRALNRFKERKRKPETNEILTGTEPEPETK